MPHTGNIGIFCHHDDEYKELKRVQSEICEQPNDPDVKYFMLKKPITIDKHGDTPGATYTHLYIRQPDPYRFHVGDIDFYLSPAEYQDFKKSLLGGALAGNARVFPRNDLDMIELYDPSVDALAYVSPSTIAEVGKIKLPGTTNS